MTKKSLWPHILQLEPINADTLAAATGLSTEEAQQALDHYVEKERLIQADDGLQLALPYWAEVYARAGMPVFPLYEPGRAGECTCGKADCTNAGKHPRTKNGLNDATTDTDQVRAWWRQWPDANIGSPVPAGEVVLDVDPRHHGTLESLGDIGETTVVHTGGDGYHVRFWLPDDHIKPPSAKHFLPGVDIRHLGNYVVLPPSIHASGERYTWMSRGTSDIPEHLWQLLSSTGNPEKWFNEAMSRCNEPGDRNTTCHWMAQQLHWDGFSKPVACEWARAYQEEVDVDPSQPFLLAEAHTCVDSAYNQGPRQAAVVIMRERTSDSDSSSHSYSDSDSDSDSNSHSYSWRMEFMGRAESADLVEAEAVCGNGDRRRWPGTPLWKRRQAQYAVLRALWAKVNPGEILPDNQMSTWLKLGEEGDECARAVDNIIAAYANNQTFNPDKPIKTLRKYMTDAQLKAIDPDHGWKRGALKNKVAEEDAEPVA